ncbi:MAG TPA: hypothetical protein VKO85_02365 [Wenzhouxiangellaceae bacterium]|nr:hypothetical protein [Wenzhouxiangellaceae bacterium]
MHTQLFHRFSSKVAPGQFGNALHPARPGRILTGLALGAAALLIAVAPSPAAAEPTDVTIRVLSRDAKFVGTSMGGARIVLRDVHTGEVLASGVTEGGTGNTSMIMHRDGGRRTRMADGSAASFSATLDLDEPRLIEAEATGPAAQPQAEQRVSATQWVVPGRAPGGREGWILELPGFAVDVLAPPAHVRFSGDLEQVEVRANVTMMCGCPIEPGGLWDADGYEVEMIVVRNGERIDSRPMAYAGQTSQFAGEFEVGESGVYAITVYAYDPRTGNTGLDRTTFIVQ